MEQGREGKRESKVYIRKSHDSLIHVVVIFLSVCNYCTSTSESSNLYAFE